MALGRPLLAGGSVLRTALCRHAAPASSLARSERAAMQRAEATAAPAADRRPAKNKQRPPGRGRSSRPGPAEAGDPAERSQAGVRSALDRLQQQRREMQASTSGAAPAVMATAVPRQQNVTDGAWDAADAAAVQEAQRDDSGAAAPAAGGPLLGRSREELEALAAQLGQPKYRGRQLHEALLKGARSLDQIATVPKALREALIKSGHTTGRSLLARALEARDGTQKLLLQLADGRVVETVGIPSQKDGRLTACVSSQVGCPMRCTFCATGKGGFARNLAPHEIADQVLAVQERFGRRVSNVVFMGMGEPLLNLRGVLAAVRFLTQDVGIGARHVTISTVGVPNAIMRLASQRLQCTLAVSIHAPTQALREQLVPSAKVYPLEALLLDCHKYFEVTGRRITFEYALMAGVNDGVPQAQQLAALLKRFDLRTHVNLIPWNPVDESAFARPPRAAVDAFAAALTAAGVATSVRVTRGLDAAAACGQLRNQHQRTPLPDFAPLT